MSATAKAFYYDPWFLAALAAGGICWLVLGYLAPGRPASWDSILSWRFAILVVWGPWWEELLFRGLLQGALRRTAWGLRQYGGLSAANLITASLFTLGHFWQHAPGWAIAVLMPGLLFGACRDRYDSVMPAMVLHAFYNAGYFLVRGLPQ